MHSIPKELHMPTVELLFFPDCPNISVAREQLLRAFATVGLSPSWSEHDVTAENAPAHVRGYGSPTILVDGRDVTGDAPAGGSACRIYMGSDVRGAPPMDAIVTALQASPLASPRKGFGSSLAILPSVLSSALPVVACPSCWPAYAGVLSALGVPFLMGAAWLLPITAGTLLIALGSLAYQARRHRSLGPLVLGAAAATAVLIGKFVLEVDAVVYTGTALLIGAAVWSSRPKKAAHAPDSCSCAPME